MKTIARILFLALPLVIANSTVVSAFQQGNDPAKLWEADASKGIERAKASNKLLLFVQVQTDFLESPFDSPEIQNFQGHGMIGSKVQNAILEHAVLIAQPCGRPGNVTFSNDTSQEAPTERLGPCITWICDCNQNVIRFLPGYPSSKTLAAAIKDAANLISGLPNKELETTTVIKSWNVGKTAIEDRALFKNLFKPSKSRDPDTKNRESVVAAMSAAVASRNQRLQIRFGNYSKVVVNFPEIEDGFFRLALANFPSLRLDHVDHHVWESLTMRPFWRIPRQEVIDWTKAIKDRPLLVKIVEPSVTTRKQKPWPPASRAELKKSLEDFEVKELSFSELAFVVNEFGKELEFSIRDPPKFWISTSDCRVSKLLNRKNAERDLLETLDSIKKSQ